LLGPGTSITHAAVALLAETGTSIVWTGEDGANYYANGYGETNRGYHLLHQIRLACDPVEHMKVVHRMYKKRFNETFAEGMTIDQLRGLEGVRMRTAYQFASKKYGVPWSGRSYDRANWENANPINRALSAANAVLNGICHAAIVSGGYSAAVGFIHTGRQTSFVYDVADLYKVAFTIPIAFHTVSVSKNDVEHRARKECREWFREGKLLKRILPDIDEILQITSEGDWQEDIEQALPADWWEFEDEAMPGEVAGDGHYDS
jgi:CRISPR-associated protein Cas1